jgi:catechol 2,3-dioxygenase-like lactoylglutathione lyase family enzyme
MLRGVANVWVPVQDVERALDFYENTLGFEVIKRDGPWAEIDASGLNIGLNDRERKGAGRRRTRDHLPARRRPRRRGREPQGQRGGLSRRDL